MKKSKQILFGIIFILICITCFLTFNILKKDKNISRTIMIYMVGADLESKSSLATTDLNSIDYKLMDNKNIKVVLIAGGSIKWNNSYISEDETSIFELKENGFQKVKTQNIKNMGDENVFKEYLDYVYDNYKTDKYDLVFWNHGGAIYGSEMDEISEDVLSLDEMKNGLKNSKFSSNKLETIIFRTCLNGTLEVADTLSNYSNYLVASEEITYGSSFTSVLNFINKIDSKDNGYDVGYKFIESYKEHINKMKQVYSENSNIYSTYSIINLSKINKLTNELNNFVKNIDVVSNYNEIAKIRSNLYQYAYMQSDSSEYDMVDLYNLVYNLRSLNEKDADKVLKEITNIVEYNWATNNNSRGISIYFPYNAQDKYKKMFLEIYKNFNNLKEYYNFINEFYKIQSNSNATYSFNSNKIELDKNNKEADFKLELTEEQKRGFAKASYIVFRDNKDGYYHPIYMGTETKLNGNTLSANIKDRQLKVIDKKSKNKKGYILTLIESEAEENYIKYNTNVILNNFTDYKNYKMDNAKINLILNRKTNKIEINNVVLNTKKDLKPNSTSIDLNKYKTVAFGSFKYKILDDKGNYKTNWNSNGVYEGVEVDVKNIDFEIQSFDDEYDYYSVFAIRDTNNKIYYSKLIKMK